MKGFTAPLISIKWLAEHLEHRDLIILNATIPKVTGKDNFIKEEAQQIKNARFFDIKNVFSDTSSSLPNTFPSATQFEIEAKNLGINKNSFIVVYDDYGIYSSPRAWWLFKSFGHKNIAVLNGGLRAWKEAGFPIESPKTYDGNPGNFKALYQENSVKNSDDLLAVIASNDVKILDARSPERYHGSIPEPRKGLRSGHIPSSLNLPYTELIDDHTLKSKSELQDRFKRYINKDLIFSCGSGITACILALGAELVGHEKISVYDGSWTEWGSNHNLPIE